MRNFAKSGHTSYKPVAFYCACSQQKKIILSETNNRRKDNFMETRKTNQTFVQKRVKSLRHFFATLLLNT